MILQDFLICGLIAIGEEDKRLEWLDAAASILAKDFLKHKCKLINSTLVALDEELPENEPVFDEVEAAVLKHWKTLRGKYPDRPRQHLRGVIFAALDKVKENVSAATIIWLVGGHRVPLARLGKERPRIEQLFVELGEIAESSAAEAWATTLPGKDLKLPGWSLKLERIKPPAINTTWLQERLGSAAGDGNNFDNFPNNPHLAGRDRSHGINQHPQWAAHFSGHAANALSAAINSVVTAFGQEVASQLSQIDTPLKEHGAAVNTAVREAIQQGMQIQVAQERRTALLWWRQTLYSPSQRRGYRGLTPGVIALLMAFDLHKQMPAQTPLSVEFLLREAVREVEGAQVKVNGNQFFSELAQANASLSLADLLGTSISESAGRICLAGFAQQTLAGRAAPSDLGGRVGLPSDQALPLEEWAVWLFRDFQALRLAAGK